MTHFRIATARHLTRGSVNCSDAEWQAISQHALPMGFRYLVSALDDVVEPALLFLHDRCVTSGSVRAVGNTERAYCDDLFEWFSYLLVLELRWDDVCHSDIAQYRDILLSSLSPKTGTPYKVGTVRRRLSTIRAFYLWAAQQNLCDALADAGAPSVERGPAPTSDGSDLVPGDNGDNSVDAINPDELVAILNMLGPLPSQRLGSQSSRNRLAASVAVSTGMRIDEVAGLTVTDITNLRRVGARPSIGMRITRTKGSKPRKVLLPVEMHDELLAYIDGERSECASGRTACDALFLNVADASRNPGAPVSTHTFSRDFRRAVIGCGLASEVMAWKVDRFEPRTVARHHFHDLRHTYAVLMYRDMERRGKRAPWLILSRLLGHANPSTTVRIYLRSVTEDDAELTDDINDYLRRLRDG